MNENKIVKNEYTIYNKIMSQYKMSHDKMSQIRRRSQALKYTKRLTAASNT